jgi:hypothetical protein
MAKSKEDVVTAKWTSLFMNAERSWALVEKAQLRSEINIQKLAEFAIETKEVLFKRKSLARNCCEAVIRELHTKGSQQTVKQYNNNVSHHVSRLVAAVKELIPKEGNYDFFFDSFIVNS